jgi:AcrR family transcriptional regulator
VREAQRSVGKSTREPDSPSRTTLSKGFRDPLTSLPETAQRLLLAAKTIITRDGFEALTLNAVSQESGENKAMISYYFENKAGLVASVLESVIHDEFLDSKDRMRNVRPEDRPRRLVEEMRRANTVTRDFLVLFEMLPRVLRDEALRRRLAELYAWFWSQKLEWLGAPDGAAALDNADLRGLSQLLSAVIDGLALQAAVNPNVDLANPYRVFSRMLENSLSEILPPHAGGK